MKLTYFRSSAEFRLWLKDNHDQHTELWLALYKKDSGEPTITYYEALDQALCFGWIDGVRKSVDAASYMIRFTPRKPESYWSKINTRRAKELVKLGRMQPPGAKAFAARGTDSTKRYSFERESAKLSPAYAKQFKADRKAWAFFQAQAPYYQRVATFWVVSAEREQTRLRRLQTLVHTSASHRRLDQFTSSKKS